MDGGTAEPTNTQTQTILQESNLADVELHPLNSATITSTTIAFTQSTRPRIMLHYKKVTSDSGERTLMYHKSVFTTTTGKGEGITACQLNCQSSMETRTLDNMGRMEQNAAQHWINAPKSFSDGSSVQERYPAPRPQLRESWRLQGDGYTAPTPVQQQLLQPNYCRRSSIEVLSPCNSVGFNSNAPYQQTRGNNYRFAPTSPNFTMQPPTYNSPPVQHAPYGDMPDQRLCATSFTANPVHMNNFGVGCYDRRRFSDPTSLGSTAREHYPQNPPSQSNLRKTVTLPSGATILFNPNAKVASNSYYQPATQYYGPFYQTGVSSRPQPNMFKPTMNGAQFQPYTAEAPACHQSNIASTPPVHEASHPTYYREQRQHGNASSCMAFSTSFGTQHMHLKNATGQTPVVSSSIEPSCHYFGVNYNNSTMEKPEPQATKQRVGEVVDYASQEVGAGQETTVTQHAKSKEILQTVDGTERQDRSVKPQHIKKHATLSAWLNGKSQHSTAKTQPGTIKLENLGEQVPFPFNCTVAVIDLRDDPDFKPTADELLDALTEPAKLKSKSKKKRGSKKKSLKIKIKKPHKHSRSGIDQQTQGFNKTTSVRSPATISHQLRPRSERLRMSNTKAGKYQPVQTDTCRSCDSQPMPKKAKLNNRNNEKEPLQPTFITLERVPLDDSQEEEEYNSKNERTPRSTLLTNTPECSPSGDDTSSPFRFDDYLPFPKEFPQNVNLLMDEYIESSEEDRLKMSPCLPPLKQEILENEESRSSDIAPTQKEKSPTTMSYLGLRRKSIEEEELNNQKDSHPTPPPSNLPPSPSYLSIPRAQEKFDCLPETTATSEDQEESFREDDLYLSSVHTTPSSPKKSTSRTISAKNTDPEQREQPKPNKSKDSSMWAIMESSIGVDYSEFQNRLKELKERTRTARLTAPGKPRHPRIDLLVRYTNKVLPASDKSRWTKPLNVEQDLSNCSVSVQSCEDSRYDKESILKLHCTKPCRVLLSDVVKHQPDNGSVKWFRVTDV